MFSEWEHFGSEEKERKNRWGGGSFFLPKIFLSLTMGTFMGNISVGARSSRVLWNGGVLFDFQNQGKVFFCFFQGGGGVDEGDTSRDSPCFFNVIYQ